MVKPLGVKFTNIEGRLLLRKGAFFSGKVVKILKQTLKYCCLKKINLISNLAGVCWISYFCWGNSSACFWPFWPFINTTWPPEGNNIESSERIRKVSLDFPTLKERWPSNEGWSKQRFYRTFFNCPKERFYWIFNLINLILGGGT